MKWSTIKWNMPVFKLPRKATLDTNKREVKTFQNVEIVNLHDRWKYYLFIPSPDGYMQSRTFWIHPNKMHNSKLLHMMLSLMKTNVSSKWRVFTWNHSVEISLLFVHLFGLFWVRKPKKCGITFQVPLCLSFNWIE